jgi:putative nucleotidyltransferase with HDIG domain
MATASSLRGSDAQSVEDRTDGRISLPEIISALSFALDLTEGAVRGHAVRSCLLGMRIATEAQLPPEEMWDLYYALLLKDVGCSSNAARMCQIVGGDDRAMKAGAKMVDWTRPHQPKVATFKLLWKHVLPQASPAQRLGRIVEMARTQHKNNEVMITLRCERGASILRKLDFNERAAQAVRSLDEHWDGSGYPDRLVGEEIPILSRVLAIAQHLDVFAHGEDPQMAIKVLQDRSGRWFDPELVEVVLSLDRRGALWSTCLPGDDEDETRRAAVDIEPGTGMYLDREHIDRICEAFADVVDAKSPYTFRHSMGVTNAALMIVRALGMSQERVDFIRRAALLHDIGKLSIPNSILDKPGKLTPEEFITIQDHAVQTQRILGRISAFRELSVVAGQHHERLDGNGYPYGLTARDLSLESRIIAVADVYGALREDRPYRPGRPIDEIISIMRRDLPHKLDDTCFEALMAGLEQGEAAADGVSLPVEHAPIFDGPEAAFA